MTTKRQGTCSVCLRAIQLHGDRPIRHGFRAIGVRHGGSSGYHTGPCNGTNFPHLGVSAAGTEWALRDAQERLKRVELALTELARDPDLTWYPSIYKAGSRLPDTTRPVVLRRGEDIAYSNDGRPTYASEHRRRVAEQTNLKDMIERAIASYEKVLATYSPDQYPATGTAPKEETTHMTMPRSNARLGQWSGVTCRFTRPGFASDKLAKTGDTTRVTCKACKKALGLPS